MNKLPIHNLENEKQVLGIILCYPEALEKVAEQVLPQDFYNTNNRTAYEAMLSVKEVDLITVANYLEEKKQLDQIGGRAFLISLTTEITTSLHLDEYIKIIKEKKREREIQFAAQRILDGKDVSSEIKKLSELQDVQFNKDIFQPIKTDDLIKKDIKEFPYLVDRLVPENAITALTADSGSGKSLIGLIMAQAIASGDNLFGEYRTKKAKVLIIDQEMDEDLLIGRVKSILQKNTDIIWLYEQFFQIDNISHYNWLKKYVKENEVDFVIFDTFSMIHSKRENDSGDMVEIHKLMLQFIAETKTTIMYMHHHRKRQKDEGFSQASAMGSVQIIAKCGSHLLIRSQTEIYPGEKNVIKATIQQEKKRRPEYIDKIGVDITYDFLAQTTRWEYKGIITDENIDLSVCQEIKAFLLRNGQRSSTEIIEELKRENGFSYYMIDKHLKYLEKNDEIQLISGGGSGRKRMYSLSDEEMIDKVLNS